jgi:hypothetical protein
MFLSRIQKNEQQQEQELKKKLKKKSKKTEPSGNMHRWGIEPQTAVSSAHWAT